MDGIEPFPKNTGMRRQRLDAHMTVERAGCESSGMSKHLPDGGITSARLNCVLADFNVLLANSFQFQFRLAAGRAWRGLTAWRRE